MTGDFYRGAAHGWADGAAIVYAPLAARLVARSPVPLAGARVLDIGAGTGVAEAPLREARVGGIVALDRSHDMLAFHRDGRPGAVVADIMHLPLRAASFQVVVASFVLNHLADPVGGLLELARVLRGGGVILASVFANASDNSARDRVDEVAQEHGWLPPEWYREMKGHVIPLLGAAGPMTRAAAAAGLVDIDVEETIVDIGLTDPADLVRYRYGQAQFRDWLARIDVSDRRAAYAAALAALGADVEPYQPRVVFLTARTSSTG
jgi:ubiquinone/menaquinone biosynthesis C-methylase UbiE